MSVLRCTKSKRLSPGRWRAPAVMMHKREPALTEKSIQTKQLVYSFNQLIKCRMPNMMTTLFCDNLFVDCVKNKNEYK